MSITIKDVAKKAGVTHSTVSLVLNKRGYVSDHTRQRVTEAIKALNYVPNEAARHLKRKMKLQTKTIGVILCGDVIKMDEASIFSKLLYRLQLLAPERDIKLLCAEYIGKKHLFDLKMVNEGIVDSLILLDCGNVDLVNEARRLEIPYLLALPRASFGQETCFTIDNKSGVKEAISYLVGLGHRRIAHITGLYGHPDGEERKSAFLEAVRDFRLEWRDHWMKGGDFGIKTGYSASVELIDGADRPTAVFYANDNMAIGGMRAFLEKGIRVGDDISIVGFDDAAVAHLLVPPLTTVGVDYETMGAEMLNRLEFQRVDTAPLKITIPTSLVIRASCRRMKNISTIF